MSALNEIGKVYYDYTVVKFVEDPRPGRRYLCRCKCGRERAVYLAHLKKGRQKRCRSCDVKSRKIPNGCRVKLDALGKTFSNWTVLKEAPKRYGSKAYWLCRCVCGAEAEVSSQQLVKSRGNCKKCLKPKGNRKHGGCSGGKEPLYHVWNSIKNRCRNHNIKSYSSYGGRGIDICDEWHDSFDAFKAAVGEKPFRGASLDRIDNNRGYEPGNVRWASTKQQAANTRKQKYGICVSQWSKENNRDRFHVAAALKKGMTLDQILQNVTKPYEDY